MRLLAKAEPGAYHVTDSGQCTWFELTQHIAAQVRAECDVKPCTTDEFPRPAKRPAYSVLDTKKTDRAIGSAEDWRYNVAVALKRSEA